METFFASSSCSRAVAAAVVAAACSGAFVQAADWPQWRGPNRDGISSEKGLLQQWPAGGPKLVWQVNDLGSGYSTPAVVGDRIYVMGNKGMESEYAQARSVKDGKLIWSTEIGRVGVNRGPQYPAARSTPTVDGDHIFTLGSNGDMACLDAKTGAIVWKKSLVEDFNGTPGNWAYAESPLVDGDKVICTPGGAEATMVALDRKTGEVVWKALAENAGEAAYSSPIPSEAGGRKQYVQFVQKGLIGVDAETGKLLWRYDRTATGSPANIPTPVANRDYVYSAANRTGGALVKIGSAGGGLQATEVYFSRKLPSAIGGAVLVDKHLYGASGENLLCAEFETGEVKWDNRSIAPASICYADGRLYLHGEDGQVALVEATPDGYREKGRFTPPGTPVHDGRNPKAWAYPAIADGKLYIRDLDSLWCYDVKER
jgi:outer membrane protein assembly factor BamB